MLYLLDDLIAMYPSSAVSVEGLFAENIRILVEIDDETRQYKGIRLMEGSKETQVCGEAEKRALKHLDNLVRTIYAQLETVRELRDMSIPHRSTNELS